MRRFNEGVYRSPSRPGISYMLSPFQRLFGGPGSLDTKTVNIPHYMFEAPNLSSKEISGGPVMGRYPYLRSPGPHAYMIVKCESGESPEDADLLKELCAYRGDFCMYAVTTKGQLH